MNERSWERILRATRDAVERSVAPGLDDAGLVDAITGRRRGRRSGGKRVLIAAQDGIARLDLAEMLAEAGHEVVAEVGDGEAAVHFAEAHRPDVVVCEFALPAMDGLAVAEKLVSGRIAPVVVLTAFGHPDLVERAYSPGAMAYLIRPFQASDLMPVVDRVTARFAELVALHEEIGDLAERLQARKLVARAEGLLMTRYGLTEPQAFRWLQRTALDNRLSMQEVAARVIAEFAAADEDLG